MGKGDNQKKGPQVGRCLICSSNSKVVSGAREKNSIYGAPDHKGVCMLLRTFNITSSVMGNAWQFLSRGMTRFNLRMYEICTIVKKYNGTGIQGSYKK